MTARETSPLTGPATGAHERISLKGAVMVFFAVVVLFGLASFSARSLFPRGVKGRASKQEAIALSEVRIFEDEVLPSLSPVHVTTQECTGDRSLPVLMGVDFVAYRSLKGGQPAVYGSDQYSALYRDYLFYFSSLQNKIAFENDPVHYLPAWGGFCSYGIAHEIVWNAEDLGPASNPDYWLISDDVLYLFRSSVPLGRFTLHTAENVNHGTAMWNEWFGKENGWTPFNTACFCTDETCVDA